MRQTTDILIAGGGIAGMIATLALAETGHAVTLASPAPPETDPAEKAADLRSTAYLQPARTLMERIGLWDMLPEKTPLQTLRIVDSAGTPPQVTHERAFHAADLGDAPFGWNIANTAMAAALIKALGDHPRVTVKTAAFDNMLQREAQVIARLSDGSSIAAQLLIGADGRGSAVREAAGIAAQTTRYGQTALAFVVTHPIPHQNVSNEIYRTGGPFTTVPMPDVNGLPASAIVWMNLSVEAERLMALETPDFEAEMSARSCHELGPLTLASPLRGFPIISQRAQSLTRQRVALIAEAAHVMPPIGAQGLNTSLQDVVALLAALEGNAPGSPEMLKSYTRARSLDVAARVAAIDLFNRVTRSGNSAVQAMRGKALEALYDLTPLRRTVMRAGLGAKSA